MEWNDRGTNKEGKLCLSVKTLWNCHYHDYTMLVPPTELMVSTGLYIVFISSKMNGIANNVTVNVN